MTSGFRTARLFANISIGHDFGADIPPTDARHGSKPRFHALRVRDAVQHVLQLTARVFLDCGRRFRVRVIEYRPCAARAHQRLKRIKVENFASML